MIGKVIEDKYRIEELIDFGGMGEVYKASCLKNGEIFAIKSPHAYLLSDTGAVQRFYEEAKIACRAKHINIVKGYSWGKTEGRPYLIMEYLKGESVKGYLKRRGKISVKEAINIVSQVAEALDYLYRKKMIRVHRDLKPSNLFMTPEKVIKLMDFGVSKIYTDKEVTKTKSQIGVVNYASPEQLRDSKRVDLTSDIWSLGIIFYELITGKKPFQGRDDASTIFQILYSKPVPVLLNTEERLCWNVITKQLRKDAKKRYRNFKTLLEDLEIIGEKIDREKRRFFLNSKRIKKTLKVLMKMSIYSLFIVFVILLFTRTKDLALEYFNKVIIRTENISSMGEKKKSLHSPDIEGLACHHESSQRRIIFTVDYFDEDGDRPESFFLILRDDKGKVFADEVITKEEKELVNGLKGKYETVFVLKEKYFTKEAIKGDFVVSDGLLEKSIGIFLVLFDDMRLQKKGIAGTPEPVPEQPAVLYKKKEMGE